MTALKCNRSYDKVQKKRGHNDLSELERSSPEPTVSKRDRRLVEAALLEGNLGTCFFKLLLGIFGLVLGCPFFDGFGSGLDDVFSIFET